MIALSMHADRRYVEAMLAAGASAYVVKNGAASELLAAIDAVAAGGTYVSAEVPGEAGVRAPRAIVPCVRLGPVTRVRSPPELPMGWRCSAAAERGDH